MQKNNNGRSAHRTSRYRNQKHLGLLQDAVKAAAKIEHLEDRTLMSSGPIVITTGGTYTGDWVSTNPNQAAVTIDTTQPVTIINSTIQSEGNLIQTEVSGAQLTVENTTATALNPEVAGKANGQFLEADNAASIDLENNDISNVGGYAIDINGFSGDGVGNQTVKILNNSITNVNGKYSNGDGGYESSGTGTPHAIILEQVHGVAGIQIAYNSIVNQPGQSYVNDMINIYDSSGTSTSAIDISNNYIDGLYSIDPSSQYDSGCGIITDGETGSGETAYVNIHDNTIISTGNAGIGIAAGHDIQAYDNTVLSSGLLSTGGSVYGQNVGVYVWDQMTGGSSSTFYNDGASDNTIGWVQQPGTMDNSSSTAKENNYWFPDGTASLDTGNTTVSTVTLATEQAQAAVFAAKLAAAGQVVGVTTASSSTSGSTATGSTSTGSTSTGSTSTGSTSTSSTSTGSTGSTGSTSTGTGSDSTGSTSTSSSGTTASDSGSAASGSTSTGSTSTGSTSSGSTSSGSTSSGSSSSGSSTGTLYGNVPPSTGTGSTGATSTGSTGTTTTGTGVTVSQNGGGHHATTSSGSSGWVLSTWTNGSAPWVNWKNSHMTITNANGAHHAAVTATVTAKAAKTTKAKTAVVTAPAKTSTVLWKKAA